MYSEAVSEVEIKGLKSTCCCGTDELFTETLDQSKGFSEMSVENHSQNDTCLDFLPIIGI